VTWPPTFPEGEAPAPSSPTLLRLRADHQTLLSRLEDFGPTLEASGDQPTPEVRAAVADILAFIDYEVWTHFAVEEEALFPLLHDLFPSENAPVAGGPVFVLSEEHKILRKLVARIEEGVAAWERGEEGSAEALRLAGRQAIRAFQKHIYKEDNIVFRLADMLMSKEDRAALESVAERLLAAG
jgi:hemerythrin-like domain-containing protein